MISIVFIHLNCAEHQLQEIRELSTTPTSASSLTHFLGKITWRATTLRDECCFSFATPTKKRIQNEQIGVACVSFSSDLDVSISVDKCVIKEAAAAIFFPSCYIYFPKSGRLIGVNQPSLLRTGTTCHVVFVKA